MALKKVGLAFVAENGDMFVRTLDRVDDAGDKVNNKMGYLARTLDKSFKDISRGAKEHLGHVLVDSAFAAGAAIGSFVTGSVDAAGKFESTMNRFASVAGSSLDESGKSLQDFDALFMQMGADTQYSAQQAGDAAIELAKGGRSAAQVFDELGDSLALASAGEVDLAKAAELSAKQLAIWEDQGVDSAEVADLLAQAANASTVGVDDLGIGLANVGGVAKVAGLSFEETVQTLAQIAPGFSSASDAGTSFKAFLNNLQPTTKPAREAMAELNLLAADGTSKFYDAQGAFIGMEGASQLLHEATKGLSEAERSLALETIFGSDAQRAAALIAEDGAKGYLAMGESMEKAGSATDQASAKNKGYAFQLETLKGSLETFQIRLGRLLIGPATEFIMFLTDAVNGLTTLVDIVNGSTDATEENAESHSSLAKVLSVLPFGQAAATAMEYRHQQRLLAEESERLGAIVGGTINKGFGLMSQHLNSSVAGLRETKVAMGELGRTVTPTTEELGALAKELEKINQAGATAAQDVLKTDVAYMQERRDRRSEHYATLRGLQEEYNAAETDAQRASIDAQILAESTGFQEQDTVAAVAYARQRAAQQAHLGELLVNWTNTQIAMGTITAEQGDAINETIATKFGVAADNTALLFGKMTQEIKKTAETGGDINALGDTLRSLQGDAAATQLKINALEQQAFAKLRKEYDAGRLSLDEYTQKILDVPKEVRTKVELDGKDKAQKDAVALGYAMSQGLATGVANGRGLVAGAVQEAIGAAYAAGRSYAGVASPSRLFAQLGRPLAEGLGMGIDMGMPSAIDALLGGIGSMQRVGVDAIGRVGDAWAQAMANARPAGWSWDPEDVITGWQNASGGGGWGALSLTGGTVRPPATPSQIATSYATDNSRHVNVNLSPTYHNTPPRPDRDSAQAAALASIL